MVSDTSGERVEPEPIRDRSLAAADELFYEHGITSVGIDAVRDRAGVGLKGIYREFGSKAGLVSAYLAHRDEQWMRWLEARIAQAGDGPRQRLLGLFDALDAWFASPGFAGCAFIKRHIHLSAVSWLCVGAPHKWDPLFW